jgi:hypothetical protein
MKFAVAVATLALTASAATAASAGVLMSNNFDSEAGGVSVLNYTGFSNLTVTAGTVDLVRTPDYGITCAGGGGSCVDLDGSTLQSGALSTGTFAFNAGQKVTFTFDLSGNQRNGNSDTWSVGFNFGGATLLASYNLGGAFGTSTPFSNFVTSGVNTSTSVLGNQGFGTYEVNFVTLQAGTFNAYLQTVGDDNIGPVVDNLLLTSTPVPEPATWALMLGGFGLAGVALRRRPVAIAA